MRASEAIRDRRSIKRFTDRIISRDEIETLITAASLAPNHRLTQPWRFYVLGPESRYAYGVALGDRKARKLPDAEAARALREKVGEEHRALPVMLAVAMVQSDDAEIREEDYAAVMMAVENLALTAVEMGLGTHLKTGAILADPAARAAVTLPDVERIVAVVNIGEPAEVPAAKARSSAPDITTWTA